MADTRSKRVERIATAEAKENARRYWEKKRQTMPCKNGQPHVEWDGSCLRCGADQGVACRDAALKLQPAGTDK